MSTRNFGRWNSLKAQYRGCGDAAVEVAQQRPRVGHAEAARELARHERRQRRGSAAVPRPPQVPRQPRQRARRQHRVMVLCRLERPRSKVVVSEAATQRHVLQHVAGTAWRVLAAWQIPSATS